MSAGAPICPRRACMFQGGHICLEVGLSAPRRPYLPRGGSVCPEAGLSIPRMPVCPGAGMTVLRRVCLSRGRCICPEAGVYAPRLAHLSRCGHVVPRWAYLMVPEGAAPVRGGVYRGTSPMQKRPPLEPYSRAVPRALGGSLGGGRFVMI